MNGPRGGLILLVVFGVALVGYGVFVGDQGSQYLGVEGPKDESGLATETAVIEYDELDPRTQDAFRKSFETDEMTRIADSPNFESGSAIRYEGAYYPTYVIVSDAGQTTMVTSIIAGVLCFLAAPVGWRMLGLKPIR
ncbi:hypothetical protein [Halosimplex sp. TS25]|uniref:hypothetical protein n=1 Tax=Halosimplex rarum TaxID=3396619 RepID=UPI0039E986CE